MHKVLLVEDDSSLADWIAAYLLHHDFVIKHVADGALAVQTIKDFTPDIILLDVMLPNVNGFDICQQARAFYQGPILMLTACNEENDELKGFELGVTDFVAKPVRPKILLARIQSLLKRHARQQVATSDVGQTNVLQFGCLTLDATSKAVTLQQNIVSVTPTEFDLLWCLASQAGEIVSREQLLKTRRGIEYDGFDRSIDIAVSRLRKKLGDTASPSEKIKTIRAKGYLFVANAWS
ncbi:DNA-binding response regulator [Saccharobesus litoralis]|uniref:DNA-binding response regulator n=1 Tax=Saccharobesus litoralis TaxID=2172099 RepID=A0A2S0VQ92_9ALTE|nr:response regulator [Saccharobesus litoralis]AWB66385.1 DNA-binding response regulator [Saccharobesus litoralis]